ncbi:MAG: hypothetical protein M1383_04105 [Patescibacteria group bacterium]|nr:hypothetical protein [Patescibacteria group bacterium]
MRLNRCGKIAEECWINIPKHFNNIALDIFQTMPNHLHGIIIIQAKDTPWRVPTAGLHPLIPNSLPAIINQYKGSVKRGCNKAGLDAFHWQSRFYNHVIRQDESLDKIREYIKNNPLKWELERNNPENLWM